MGLFPVLKLLMSAFKTRSKTVQITCRNLQADRLILWSQEIKWNANLMQLGNFIDVFLPRHVSGTYAHHQEHWMLSCSTWFSAPSFWMDGAVHCTIRTMHARPTQRLSKPPPIQKLGTENHMLQLNIQCSWWWAYVPETCQAKNTLTLYRLASTIVDSPCNACLL